MSLMDWLTTDVLVRSDIKEANKTVKILAKVWRRYKKYLVSSYSLLQVFYNHPDFRFLQPDYPTFLRGKKGLLRFKDILRARFPEFVCFVFQQK